MESDLYILFGIFSSIAKILASNGSLIKHASQLPAGIHVVDIHHPDGCIVTDSIYIQDGVPVIDSSSVTDLSCYYVDDASISLFPSQPSTTGFSWSTGSSQSNIDFLPPGDYAVEAYNMNCTDSLFFTNSFFSMQL